MSRFADYMLHKLDGSPLAAMVDEHSVCLDRGAGSVVRRGKIIYINVEVNSLASVQV